MSEKAILFDTSRCSGCHACQVACKCWNNLSSPLYQEDRQAFTGTHQNPPDLNGNTRLIMLYNELVNEKYGNVDVNEPLATKRVKWAFGRRACQHCTDAPCASICPAAALYRDEATGMITHDQSKCIGCQYCSAACPFDVPRYTPGLKTVINKCYGCVDRIENGMPPACVSTCQPEALTFGDRDEIIAQAKSQVARLKELGYEDACVYGETEMGGLHVIQVLKYGIEAHQQVENPKAPALLGVTKFIKPLTAVVTPVVIAGLGFMAILATGYKRDKLVYNPETGDTINYDTGEIVKHGDPQDDRTFKEALTENLPFLHKSDAEEVEAPKATDAAEAAEDSTKEGE